MSFSVGITGLPNVGKSTLFNALTQDQVDISNYPFCTIEPNVGVVEIPDQRLEKIAEVVEPEKVTPTIIEFVDIAGLVKQAHQGQGLGNQFLAHIRECDAILEVVRAFEDEKIEHVPASRLAYREAGQAEKNTVAPKRDIDIINTELIMKDLQTIEKALKENHSEQKLLEKIEQALEQEKLIADLQLTKEEKRTIKEFQLLTAKPVIYLFNGGESVNDIDVSPKLKLDIKMEQEVSHLSAQEKKELAVESHLDKLVSQCYNSLNLITFYTITGGQEARAWTLKKGKDCPQAGGVVHSDFEENFIKAEAINWHDLVKAGSWKQAKQNGLVRTVGQDYIVKDGDVIEFKI